MQVTRILPNVTTKEAKDAWIKHHWKKGGGLPIFIFQKDEGNRRLIAPILMEEALDVPRNNGFSISMEYTVTKPGPFFQDVVVGSHEGMIKFEPLSSGGCKMTWDVAFETKKFKSLFQQFTAFTVGIAATTVAESVEIPRTLTVETTLPGTNDPEEARREWLELCWSRGGGLPLFPPFSFGEILEDGGGLARKSILRVPPLIIENVLSTKTSSSMAEAFYEIGNPGWMAFPFLVHTHLGRTRFLKSSEGGVDLSWEMQIRSYSFMAPIIETLSEMIITTIVRNLKVALSEPKALVEMKPPWDNTDMGISSFGSVPKESWFGGVLDAHLSDRRSLEDQIVSIFKPWTWGRSGDGGETDSVQSSWSDGEMAP